MPPKAKLSTLREVICPMLERKFSFKEDPPKYRYSNVLRFVNAFIRESKKNKTNLKKKRGDTKVENIFLSYRK